MARVHGPAARGRTGGARGPADDPDAVWVLDAYLGWCQRNKAARTYA